MIVAGREEKEEERTADRELGDACWLGDSARLVLEDLRVHRWHRAVTGGVSVRVQPFERFHSGTGIVRVTHDVERVLELEHGTDQRAAESGAHRRVAGQGGYYSR